MIQIGGVYTTFCEEEGVLLQKYHDRNGRCIAILFKSIGVRGRFHSAEFGKETREQKRQKSHKISEKPPGQPGVPGTPGRCPGKSALFCQFFFSK